MGTGASRAGAPKSGVLVKVAEVKALESRQPPGEKENQPPQPTPPAKNGDSPAPNSAPKNVSVQRKEPEQSAADDKEKSMVKVLEELLKKHGGTYESTVEVWKNYLNARETAGDDKQAAWDLKQHVSLCHRSYFDFKSKNYSLRLRLSYAKKAAEVFVKTGSVSTMCDLILDSLDNGRYYKDLPLEKTEEKEEEAQSQDNTEGKTVRRVTVQPEESILSTALLALWNFTDSKAVVCTAVRNHGAFIPGLVKHLDAVRLDIAERQDRDDYWNTASGIVTSGISILHNVGMEDENVTYLRDVPGLMDILKAFMASNRELWKFLAICTLADIVTDEEADALTTTSNLLVFLLRCVQMAANSKDHQAHISGTGASYFELVRAVKHLSRNNANSRLLVEKGALPLLHKGLQSEFEDERKVSIESLWWLSFLKENHAEIVAQEQLIEQVISIWKDKDDACQASAEGMLFQLRDVLKKHSNKQFHDVAEELQGGRNASEAPASGHVMLSYQSVNRSVVKMVCDYLKQNGLPVWMDIYNMAEGESSTTQTMAEAVEGAVVFLMCVSESYKNSQYCRQEAEYAFENRKHIIPLKLQKDYKPEGWLGFIQGSRFFYDFTHEQLYGDKLAKLLVAVKRVFSTPIDAVDGPIKSAQPVVEQPIQPMIIDTSHGGLSYAAPPSRIIATSDVSKLRKWTKDDVAKWLVKFQLKGATLKSLTGMDIVFLRQMNERAPECFYHLLTSQLQLKTVSDMSSFTYALEEVHTML